MKILDLFCGAGGAAMGYHQALEEAGIAHEIVGVDIHLMKRYPFTFVQGDALEYCKAHGAEFDYIHASPPCHKFSSVTKFHCGMADTKPDLIDPTRQALIATGKPYVIENVMPAPLNGIYLCGLMFGLRLFRHRKFETSFFMMQPQHTHENWRAPEVSRKPKANEVHSIYGHFSDMEGAKKSMGIDWMNRDELAEAIPPAYTRFIMQKFLEAEI